MTLRKTDRIPQIPSKIISTKAVKCPKFESMPFKESGEYNGKFVSDELPLYEIIIWCH